LIVSYRFRFGTPPGQLPPALTPISRFFHSLNSRSLRTGLDVSSKLIADICSLISNSFRCHTEHPTKDANPERASRAEGSLFPAKPFGYHTYKKSPHNFLSLPHFQKHTTSSPLLATHTTPPGGSSFFVNQTLPHRSFAGGRSFSSDSKVAPVSGFRASCVPVKTGKPPSPSAISKTNTNSNTASRPGNPWKTRPSSSPIHLATPLLSPALPTPILPRPQSFTGLQPSIGPQPSTGCRSDRRCRFRLTLMRGRWRCDGRTVRV
jgi:hypothetical protein